MFTIANNLNSLTEKGETFTSKAIDSIMTNEGDLKEDMKDDFFLFRG